MSTLEKPISPKKRYALRLVEMAEKDAEIAALQPDKEIYEIAKEKDYPLDQVIELFLKRYNDRSALGERAYKIQKDPKKGESIRSYQASYDTITYGEVRERTKAVSLAWRESNCRVKPDEFVLILGFADIDFVTLDLACAYSKAVTVPMQSSTSGADLTEIVENIQPVVIAATLADLEVATAQASASSHVQNVIVFNYDDRVDAERRTVDSAKKTLSSLKEPKGLYTISELIEYGKTLEWSWLPTDPNHSEKCVAILHSSGSTGKPKGAIMPEIAIMDNWIGRPGGLPRVTVHLAPMNHLMGRNNVYVCMSYGGTGYFTLEPDLSSLLEDIRIARPIFLSLFPRIFELIYQHYQNEVSRRARQSDLSREEVKKEVMLEMRHTFLGDRLLCIVFGSAPTAPRMRRFIKECFDVLMVEGYGNTESGTGAVTLKNKIDRNNVTDYKLRDVPELGYYSTDKPHPRGELLVKTLKGIRGYYKQPEVTKELFDHEGYMCTGDIVEERSQDEVWVIDRRKDVLKLSQGEYVAVGTLGTIYEAGSAMIKQIYVYGNSNRSYLLAVVVLEKEVLHQLLGDHPSDSEIKSLLRDEFIKVAEKEELKSFEIPRDFILEYETFSQENGFLSSVRKKLRPALKRKYGPALEEIYSSNDQKQDDRIAEMKAGNSNLSTLDKLVILLEDQLNVEVTNPEEPRSFNQLGGDSLGASLYSVTLEEVFDVVLPADTLLSPNGNLKQWASIIEKAQKNEASDRPTFNSVHGKNAQTVKREDLKLEHFIDADILKKAADLPLAPSTPNTVLLTGANGFLGHIVCLEWLKKLSKTDGKLICIIRAKDDDAAYKRLEKEYVGLDEDLEQTFKSLAKNHLEVIAGDISETSLGLSDAKFTRLAQEVDRICHVAALVNHRLSYQHLFGPNVGGTAEIIQLSLLNTLKPIDFISSVGVFMLLDLNAWDINESSPFKKELEVTDEYATGYALSKWGSEILLQQINDQLKVPVNIFRCDMIMPDRVYKGQANAPDMISRLLYSMVVTGLAPKSFYRNRRSGRRKVPHYDGIPVDILSKAIVDVHNYDDTQVKTYHALNYLKDTISLDRFVDWIESAGYPITRFADFGEWYERMETKLKSLPEDQKNLSVINLLMAYKRQFYAGPSAIDCSNFEGLLNSIEELNGLPSLSESYIHKYLNDLALLGMIDTPKHMAEPQEVTFTHTSAKRLGNVNSAQQNKLKINGYAAHEASAPLEPFSYEIGPLGPEQVDVKVAYCGICHSDLSMIDNEWENSRYPLIPGHEIIGEVVAVGQAVKNIRVGDKVGVGWFSESCMCCHQCMDGAHHLCPDRKSTIAPFNGGFADYVRSHWAWAIPIPEGVDLSKAGPLLCGGLTVFNPIIAAGVLPTDKVGVIGIGGLGHMALKFLKNWGCEVVAFSSSESKKAQITAMGANRVINSRSQEDIYGIRGELDFIINTTNVNLDWDAYLMALAPKGKFYNVGMVREPMSVDGGLLLGGEKIMSGSPVGSPSIAYKMLEFCARHDIYPDVEEFPMTEVNKALDHLRAGKARFRVVLKA